MDFLSCINVPLLIQWHLGDDMPTKNPRINVSLDKEDLEIIHILSKKRNLSLSGLIQYIIHEWLEEFEDIRLLQRIEEIENDTIEYMPHKDFWERELDKECTKLSTPSQKIKKTSRRSPKRLKK